MKLIVLRLIEEDELPFWTSQTVEIETKNYGEFTGADLALLRELTKWIKGEDVVNPIYYKVNRKEELEEKILEALDKCWKEFNVAEATDYKLAQNITEYLTTGKIIKEIQKLEGEENENKPNNI